MYLRTSIYNKSTDPESSSEREREREREIVLFFNDNRLYYLHLPLFFLFVVDNSIVTIGERGI